MIYRSILIVFFIMHVSGAISQSSIDSLGKKQGIWIVNIQYDSITELRNVFVQCEFKNDTLNGIYRVFDENEILRYEAFFFEGNRNGLGYIYDSDFNVRRVYTYYNDEVISLIYFDERNRLIETRGFMNKEWIGINSIFHSNGKMMRRSIFVGGKRNGRETIFNRKGKIRTIFEYSDDIFNGKIVSVE